MIANGYFSEIGFGFSVGDAWGTYVYGTSFDTNPRMRINASHVRSRKIYGTFNLRLLRSVYFLNFGLHYKNNMHDTAAGDIRRQVIKIKIIGDQVAWGLRIATLIFLINNSATWLSSTKRLCLGAKKFGTFLSSLNDKISLRNPAERILG